jgi:hypothetical protein
VNATPPSWRPTATLARWLCGVLVAQAVLTVGAMFADEALRWERVHGVLDSTSITDPDFNRRLTDAMNGVSGMAWVQLAGYATTAALVFWIVWSFRSAHNARALGRTGARQSPGWIIAGWLIPLVNFVLPYQTVSDLWRSSDPETMPGDEWRSRPPEPRVALWWGAYLVGVIGYVVVVLDVLTGGLDASGAKPWLAAVRGVQAVGALLGAWIVWEVTHRQARQQEREPVATRDQAFAQAGASPASGAIVQHIVRGPDGMPVPGWYPDPNGVAQHRYWDGKAWTEHVATSGVLALAPVLPVAATRPAVPADWYPDPAGRHQWRFWGGDDWTPHVNDDGVHTDDRLVAPSPPPAPHTP